MSALLLFSSFVSADLSSLYRTESHGVFQQYFPRSCPQPCKCVVWTLQRHTNTHSHIFIAINYQQMHIYIYIIHISNLLSFPLYSLVTFLSRSACYSHSMLSLNQACAPLFLVLGQCHPLRHNPPKLVRPLPRLFLSPHTQPLRLVLAYLLGLAYLLHPSIPGAPKPLLPLCSPWCMQLPVRYL